MTANPGVTPLSYSSYLNNIAVLAVINVENSPGLGTRAVDDNFNNIIPQMLNYAELRIQRDLDLLPLQAVNSSYILPVGSNVLQVSVNDFVTVQDILTVKNTTFTDSDGVTTVTSTAKKRLIPTSKEFIQEVYADSSVKGLPRYFAPLGGDNISGTDTTPGNTWMNFIVGPYPDIGYPLEIIGSTRMVSLAQYANGPNSSTGTTFISTFLPDLLLMASMVYISGYQRNFSAASDDPNMAVNYEKQYQALLKGAAVEEARKRFRASAWSSEAPAPVATPVRA